MEKQYNLHYHMIQVCGTVNKIIYRQEESGFSIFILELDQDLIKSNDNNSDLIVKGVFLQLSEKEYLKIYGDFVTDKKYGKQFQSDHYDPALPQQIDMLEKYLSTGIIRGIGPARAKLIIQRFGADTLYVMEHESYRLTEISGIGKRTAELIGRRMEERGEMQDILLKLGQYKITPALGAKIYKRYGKDTMHKIQTNPYRLIEDIRGIGFETADKIALENGVSKESPYRIKSGIVYALERCCSFGNVYYPKDKLLQEASSLMEIHPLKTEEQFQLMLDRHELKCIENNKVYTNNNYFTERRAANTLIKLCNYKKNRSFSQNILCQLNGMLDEVQMSAVRTAAENNVMVLTGGPGVGKTTTTNLIIQYFKKERKKVLLAAPTGRAAKRMKEATKEDSKTIHRLLGITADEEGVCFERNADNPLECDVVIIDETSMMDLYLADALFQAIPFGAQLILVGDKNQLPSVGAGNVLSDIIESGICPVIELKKVYRQAEGSYIISNAHAILNQQPLHLSNNSKDFFFKSCENPDDIKDLLLHYVSDSLPAFTGESDIQVLSPIRNRKLGVNELNLALQDKLNPLQNRKEVKGFRVGDKVIQTRNDYNRKRFNGKIYEDGVFNGDVGRVKFIDFENEYLHVLFDEYWEVKYEFDELDSLDLAYALTIHKSQGSEYPVVVIPVYDYIPMLTTMNLIYTGITRARKAILLIGSLKKLYRIIGNINSSKRYTGLCNLLKIGD